jgi:hypothetical protein
MFNQFERRKAAIRLRRWRILKVLVLGQGYEHKAIRAAMHKKTHYHHDATTGEGGLMALPPTIAN